MFACLFLAACGLMALIYQRVIEADAEASDLNVRRICSCARIRAHEKKLARERLRKKRDQFILLALGCRSCSPKERRVASKLLARKRRQQLAALRAA